MIVYYIVSFLFMMAGVLLVFNLTPERIAEDVTKLTYHDPTLSEQIKSIKGEKKKGKLTIEINRIRVALEVMGKTTTFTVLVAISLLLMIAGCITALAVGNPFLLPVLATGLAMIPFLYARKLISDYDRQVKEELETALSIITTSYVRNDDIVMAVRENIDYIKPPVKNLFTDFLTEASVISTDIKSIIKRLKGKIKDSIFVEWCDTLLTCQDDRTLKDTLMPVVAKYTDVRIVNNDLKTMMSAVRWEYYMMVMLVLGNIPLLRLLNKDWFDALVNTIPGKMVLAICGLTIIITAWLMYGYTRPVEYER